LSSRFAGPNFKELLPYLRCTEGNEKGPAGGFKSWEAAFSDALTAFLEERYRDLVAFVDVHNRKVKHIEKLMDALSHYKPKRAVNLQNAKIHVKAAEVNEGQAPGDCAKISEIRQLVKEDPVLQNLSEKDQQMLKNLVTELWELKKNGACPSNKASAIDYHTEIKDLNDHVSLCFH
jgi:hypothetical protein